MSIVEEEPEKDEDTEMEDASIMEVETTEDANKENQPENQSDAQPNDQSDHATERTITTTTTVSPEKLQQLVLMRTFHVDAVKFIEQIHLAIPIITQLLSSKSKAEVLESMDFLVVGYNYKVKLSSVSATLLFCKIRNINSLE